MAVIYGWAYAVFHSNVGWNRGAESVYNYWENYWATLIDSYIFSEAGTGPLTDADEKKEIQTLVNKKMMQTNLFLKGDSTERPIETGFYSYGFPEFTGRPDDNGEKGSGDYVLLNKYKRVKSEEFARLDSIRVGADPDISLYGHGHYYY